MFLAKRGYRIVAGSRVGMLPQLNLSHAFLRIRGGQIQNLKRQRQRYWGLPGGSDLQRSRINAANGILGNRQ